MLFWFNLNLFDSCNAFRKLMRRELSTETLSLITSWLADQSITRTVFSSSISVSLNAIRTQRENTSPSERAKTWLEPPDMLVLALTSVMSSQEEMTSRLLVTYSSTSSEAACLGRDFLEEARMRSTITLRKRRWKSQLMSSARATLKSSESSWTTAENYNSQRILTINT